MLYKPTKHLTMCGAGCGAGFGSSPPWTPAAPASSVIWCRSDLGTAAGALAAWPDQVAARNPVQADGAKQPTRVDAAAPSGKPVIRFGGTHWLQTGAFTLAQPTLVFVAAKWTRDAANYTHVMDGRTSGSAKAYRSPGADTVNMLCNGTSGPNKGMTEGNWYVFEFLWNGANTAIALNGGARTVGNCGVQALGGLTVGASGGGIQAFLGDMTEIAAYSADISAADRALVVAAMRTYAGF